ncbi:hypothetical protein BC834DRAFT_690702 [Gloeopeniophorella convolvens]|nr:hypothetical protein BC834DRAFT_690702 [Gloeopeniophorella convolvens]
MSYKLLMLKPSALSTCSVFWLLAHLDAHPFSSLPWHSVQPMMAPAGPYHAPSTPLSWFTGKASVDREQGTSNLGERISRAQRVGVVGGVEKTALCGST